MYLVSVWVRFGSDLGSFVGFHLMFIRVLCGRDFGFYCGLDFGECVGFYFWVLLELYFGVRFGFFLGSSLILLGF